MGSVIVVSGRKKKMTDYIDREAFIAEKRKQYCKDCAKRKGMKNGKLKFCYEIGEAPCRACGVDDALSDMEDYPAADVKPVVLGWWVNEPDRYRHWHCSECGYTISGIEIAYYYCPNCGADMREVE